MPSSKSLKIALIVGHHPSAPGAHSVCGFSEHGFYDEFVDHVIERYSGPHNLVKVERPTMAMPVALVNEIAPDFFVSFHFNSAANPHATGTEVLHYPSEASTALASIFAQRIHELLGLPLRRGDGLLARTASDRGGALLAKTRMPGVLLEPFFGSNKGDCEAVIEKYDEFVACICETLDQAASVLNNIS